MVFLRPEAADDLGNQYTDYGGVHGLSADGVRTDGSTPGQPAIDAKTGPLTVRLVFLQGQTESDCEFSLARPDRT
ncbi:hypothetical protein [Kitasatospora sp. NPDC085464]|uniref:hypothetical protein n=1 Tax=Kitasatospora sp. NPDC085464 TaxID=3364063 RepID=UPI0037CC1858